jgi:Leucine-rich repeat (LRR) protein
MTGTEGSGPHLPKLPLLDKQDIKAIRSFLPGKVLGRTAALLSLVLVLLYVAAAVDEKLKALLDANLPEAPWLHATLLIGLPSLVVAIQLWIEWRAARDRRALQSLAVKAAAVPQGYFRIGPYLDTAEDRKQFDRADNAHEKVLDWIRRSAALPLYLTGDSGSGKSSLLTAFVLPALRKEGWTIVEARAWQDPEAQLRQALGPEPGPAAPGEAPDLRTLIEARTARADKGLLLVLDQFEEFAILGKPAQQQGFAALLADLRARPVAKLLVLLSLRSDYEHILDDIGLPPLRQGENLAKIGRFGLGAASQFMIRSKLGRRPDALDRLLNSAAVLDETPGLVRPITLNVLGHVLATGRAQAPSLDAGQLVRFYIEQTIGQPAIRNRAAPVLECMVTDQGTKQPRLEADIAAAAKLSPGEVRAVLNALAAAALARPLDAAHGVWELSHDFIARAVTRQLGRRRHDVVRRSAYYTAPVLLVLTGFAGVAAAEWERWSPLEAKLELAQLGITITRTADGLVGEHNSRLTEQNFRKSGPLLQKVGSDSLTRLDLDHSPVADLTPIKDLAALTQLSLGGSFVRDLTPLKGLTALRVLQLNNLAITDLTPIKSLIALKKIDLWSSRGIADLNPLSNMTALTELDLSFTQAADLLPLTNLTALTELDLRYTHAADLTPLEGLTLLTKLNLDRTEVSDLTPLRNLTQLTRLGISGTYITDLTPVKDLTKLTRFDLDRTEVTDIAPLRNMTEFIQLDLGFTSVSDLTPIKGMTALAELDLRSTPVADLSPLKGLTALQWLHLGGTRVTDLTPIQDLPALVGVSVPEVPRTEYERVSRYREEKGLPMWRDILLEQLTSPF